MVIPGTDRETDGRMLSDLALDTGLWLTQHHTELLGARMFARVYPDLQPSYTLYPELFEGLWREAAEHFRNPPGGVRRRFPRAGRPGILA